MPQSYKLLLIYAVSINVLAYAVMCFDKFKSRKGGQRISENSLFLLAFLLGAIGIYLGMKAPLYHKAAKPKFRVGIPTLILLNGIMVFFLCRI